ncbi:Shikimate kinase [bioreactor metagenome]|uniref:Shikimate kinase n=1 Tax=bioreactor metagenome TaxID=1076179 RepID=A0A645D3R0_9ZZZZ
MKDNIILIDLSTSGKTTIGKEVSRILEKNFIDCDNLIQEKQGKTINEIFKAYDEKYFRELEKELVDNLMGIENSVVSTGGGLPIYNNNLDKLKDVGLVIFLDAPLHEIIERSVKVNDRPLLRGNIEKTISKLYNERINTYKKAHYILNTENLSIDQCANCIVNMVKQRSL